jgi:hypothetical protein
VAKDGSFCCANMNLSGLLARKKVSFIAGIIFKVIGLDKVRSLLK